MPEWLKVTLVLMAKVLVVLLWMRIAYVRGRIDGIGWSNKCWKKAIDEYTDAEREKAASHFDPVEWEARLYAEPYDEEGKKSG